MCGLDHVGLNVPDLDQAVEFFRAAFGATVVFRMERYVDPSGDAPTRLGARRSASFELAMLALPGGRLELMRWWNGQDGGSAPGAADMGGSHVAIAVTDVGAALEQLATLPDVRVLSTPVTFEDGPTPGLTNAFVSAPWGMLIELVNWS